MADDLLQHYAGLLEDALYDVHPEYDFMWRKMFGGAGYYVDGRIFAAHLGAGIALKVSDADREALLMAGGMEANHFKQYMELPESIVNDEAALVEWVERSVVFVQSLPNKKKRRR